MPAPVLVAANSDSRVYKIGRVGFDTGTQDVGGVFTATLKTEKISPLGEGGLCYFRRLVLRILHGGIYTLTVKVYVDGSRTQVYSSGVLVDQTITIVRAAPAEPPFEQLETIDIRAGGTYIEVELTVDSDDVTGVFLPESIAVEFAPLRSSKQREGEAT